MSSWNSLPRAAFDVETTGRDPLDARIVTASVVVVDASGALIKEHEWLVDPGIEIPVETTEIHGITTAHARQNGMQASTAVAQLADVLRELFDQGIPVMAFNAPYDFTVLAQEARRHGVASISPLPVIDPYVLSKQVEKYRRGKRTLVALCEAFSVPLDAAHTSAADSLATIRLADALAEKYPDLLTDAVALHNAQVGWARAQAADFQEYLRRTNADAVVNGDWPLRLGA